MVTTSKTKQTTIDIVYAILLVDNALLPLISDHIRILHSQLFQVTINRFKIYDTKLESE